MFLRHGIRVYGRDRSPTSGGGKRPDRKKRLTKGMMRPRDRINRRKNWILTVVGVGFGSLAILAFVEKFLPPTLARQMSYWAIGVFVVGLILMHVGITCPKCHAMLGLALMYSREKMTRCPKCGMDFDKENQERGLRRSIGDRPGENRGSHRPGEEKYRGE